MAFNPKKENINPTLLSDNLPYQTWSNQSIITNFDSAHQMFPIPDQDRCKTPNKRTTSLPKRCSSIIIQDSESSFRVISKNDRMIYKGGMRNGIKHGYGKEFFTNGKLGFSGGFENGKYCGAICKVFYFTGGIYYKGQMARGKKEGHGVLYNKSGW
jgi:hypothetical protein